MARVSEESKQRVRDATDLVDLASTYTDLRRSGSDRMVGRCPLHDDRTPSFTITPSKQLFHCFGCAAGGDALSLVQLKEGLDFAGALEFLAHRAGIGLIRVGESNPVHAHTRRRARELEPLDRAAEFYAAHLQSPRSPEAAHAADYLAGRGLLEDVCRRFKVGYAPNDTTALLRAAQAAGFSACELRKVGLVTGPRRGGPLQDRFRGRLTFPVCDLRGRVLGFGARKLSGQRGPKYINSSTSAIFSKGHLLFGTHLARGAATQAGVVILVEGYVDALAMHQAGLRNTVALMGTAITEHQIALLSRLAPTLLLMLDGDPSGQQAASRAGSLAHSAGMTARIATLPSDTDPAALVQHYGASAARELVRSGVRT